MHIGRYKPHYSILVTAAVSMDHFEVKTWKPGERALMIFPEVWLGPGLGQVRDNGRRHA